MSQSRSTYRCTSRAGAVLAVALALALPADADGQAVTQSLSRSVTQSLSKKVTPSLSQPTARFLRPTVRLGEVIGYELTWRHPADQNVVFPDSGADFRPFEMVRRQYATTQTKAGQSLDRATYWVRTFATDSVQTLALPGRILTVRGDTVVVPGARAAVRLQFVAPLPDPARAPALRPTLHPERIVPRFNWPWLVAGIGLFLLALGAAWLIWGRRTRARYRRYRLRKNHQYFLAQYARYIERFELSRSVLNLERAISLWKNYLTNLENLPINSLTTKEIVSTYASDTRVTAALRLGDRAIYGNQLSEDSAREAAALEALRQFAEDRYALVAAPLQPVG